FIGLLFIELCNVKNQNTPRICFSLVKFPWKSKKMFLNRQINRLWSLSHVVSNPGSSTRFFNSTPVLMAEPLKKKKKLDPMIIKQREERRKKKIEKQIRRLEKNARQLKPIDELEIPFTLIDEKDQRQRPLQSPSMEVLEQRALLQKQWARHKRTE
uniref:Large ribosomal subunit protein mL40 n=1 Tax=Phlebotomus papatasi TaxID=29031 RepID=A0A1B0GPN6_PHLPP